MNTEQKAGLATACFIVSIIMPWLYFNVRPVFGAVAMILLCLAGIVLVITGLAFVYSLFYSMFDR
jgi:hypothetical protein